MSRAFQCDRCEAIVGLKQMVGCVSIDFNVTTGINKTGDPEGEGYSDIELCRSCTAKFKELMKDAVIGWPRPKVTRG